MGLAKLEVMGLVTMTEPVAHPPDLPPESWAQLAALKPQLRPHLQFYLHHYRGQAWYYADVCRL